jgi:hypothetical protein
MTLVFILVPAGAVRPAVACSGHYIALHRGARRGGLQAWRERRSSLQVPKVLIEASANIAVKAESVRVIAIPRRSPLRLGDCPSFYRPRREQFTGVPHYSPTCGGMASSVAELTTVLVNLAPVGASWRVLCPHKSDIEGSGVEAGRPDAARRPVRGCRRRGSVRGTGLAWRRPVPVRSNNIGDFVVVPGVALQWWGWPHRVDSDGEDRSHWLDVMA